ncbi:MAG: hypothetical protein QOD29_4952 [Alphaproteobacteria bacterium]|nr:hypothetical protein [Alphaproteobacteria bacterium]
MLRSLRLQVLMKIGGIDFRFPTVKSGSSKGTVKLRHYSKDWVESGSVSCRDGRGAPLRYRF